MKLMKYLTLILILALMAAMAVGSLAACGREAARSSDPGLACRLAARQAFTAITTDDPTMTQEEAQVLIDGGCRGLGATDRTLIVDDERDAAIARYMDGNVS